ncbi:hypothetical protein KDW_53120 [Dictyobacter vulcani]|uniref:Aromatic amino acid beta-eliminating lyase/threonine aldolase domain-containing protein n=1 Tax=Dictyobacter vulcani TaxID=2607529 RepID=A0A5J4KX77_9CHLR|nr:beta-eliminating lyase-related protein [Dictyobacter vulcani]GER91150.1 hypothetical protein KDW_53120 [Dictyobacter vulcani]
MTKERDPRQIRKACSRSLMGHYPQSLAGILHELAETVRADESPDVYGAGNIIRDFEAEVAQLLGKEAAVFMPSGTMCQPIALRIWTDRRHLPRVGYHPTSHLELHEFQGLQRLHGLETVLIGSPYQLLTLDDLKAVAEPLGALLLELPQREIGGQLPSWDELTAITGWAREHNIATHLDGARLWECKPYYQREYAEIAGLFDSVYVSFYKSLGGISGAVLAGPADMVAEARIWQRRQGGNLYQLYPYVLAARKGLAERLPRMQAYHEKAVAIAAALSVFPQIEILPAVPQTHMMHVFMRGDREQLVESALDIAEETGTWLFGSLSPTQLPAYQKFELSVGDASLDMSTDEIVSLFEKVFAQVEAAR